MVSEARVLFTELSSVSRVSKVVSVKQSLHVEACVRLEALHQDTEVALRRGAPAGPKKLLRCVSSCSAIEATAALVEAADGEPPPLDSAGTSD